MCSENNNKDLYMEGGKTLVVEGISLNNCADARKVKWVGPRHNIIHDLDGSLSGKGKATYITPYMKHLE